MEHELTDIGVCRKSMVLKFSAEEVDKALDESYAEVDQHVQIKGFRRGKAPRRLLEKKFRREARMGAEERLYENAVRPAIEKENVAVFGSLDNKTVPESLEPVKPYEIRVEFDIRPEFALPDYKGMELQEQPVAVAEEKVDEGMERFRKMFANYDPVEGEAGIGDVLNVDFKGSSAGKEFMNMQDKNLRVEGGQLFGLPYPELESKFKGARAGDKIDLVINLPEDHPDDDLKGKPAEVEIVVKQVQRPRLPELTDEFAANLGMKDIASFRARIRSNLMSEALVAVRVKQEQEIIDRLIAASSFPIPGHATELETEAILNHERLELGRKGVLGEALEKEIAGKRAEAEKTAERRVRWEIISSRIVEEEKLQVTQEDISNHVEALAQSYNTTPARVIQRVKEFNGVPAMLKEIMDIKTLQFLLDNSKGGAGESARRAEDIGNANAEASDAAGSSGETGEA